MNVYRSPKVTRRSWRRNRPDKILHHGQFIWMQAIPGQSRALSALIWGNKKSQGIRSGRERDLRA